MVTRKLGTELPTIRNSGKQEECISDFSWLPGFLIVGGPGSSSEEEPEVDPLQGGL